MEVNAHGMALYQKIDSQFYNQYLPMAFGEHTVVTPSDDGALFVNFALQPMVYQPSGHINISRAREFYIRLYSSVIGTPDPVLGGPNRTGQMICEASALNFILISDGSMILRYSTWEVYCLIIYIIFYIIIIFINFFLIFLLKREC